MRPVRTTKPAAMAYPIQTQSQDYHHERPAATMEELIIHVLMLNESATQKPTKFHAFHWRRSCSTGFRSWLVSMSWVLVRPGSWSTASLSAQRRRRVPPVESMPKGDAWRAAMQWCTGAVRREENVIARGETVLIE